MKRLLLILLLILFFVVTSGMWAANYYVATTGSNSNPGTEAQPWKTIQKAANTLTAGDTVYIKAGTYSERVVPKNSGSAGNYITYTAYPGDTVTIDGTGVTIPAYWGGLFEISGVDYIKVSGLTIRDAGPDDNHNGILIEGGNYITIENNYTYNTASSGIGVWDSSNIIIDNNEVELACNDGEQECISIAVTDTWEVKNNHIHHSGPGSIGGEGICLKDGSSNGKAYNNHVHHLNRLGIYMDAWDKHTYNIEVYGNIVHDINGNDCFTIASESGGLLENISVYNNIGYNADVAGLFISLNGDAATHPMKDLTIVNNTFYNNGGGGWGGGIAVENPNIQNVVIRNNIVSQNVTFQIEVEPNVSMSKLTIDNNLIHGYRNYGDEVRGTNYVEGDPLFVNAASADFHLKANSPAIDAASSTGAPSTDYDGNPRPSGSGYDIGAFEYQSGGGTNPEIALSRSTIDVAAAEGSTTTIDKTVTVSNSGTGTLQWSVTDNKSWLSVSPASGTDTGVVTVTVAPSGLSAGSYTGTVTVSSSNASNSPQTVTVNLTVGGSTEAVISLSRDEIDVTAIAGSAGVLTQTFTINNTGGGTLNWNASDNAGWLGVNPASGTGSAVVTVSVDASGLSVGDYTGTVTVSSSNASNSPQTVTVNLTVKSASQDQAPFGQFETPAHGSTVRSSVPVTGWALDDVAVESVKIYRNAVSGGGSGMVYIGDALLVEGARPDIEASFPGYPNNSRAGWGYMMLTNFLPNGGNGTFTLYAVAVDNSGQSVTLGTKTITCDNANAVKPFGAIDTPLPGGTASGAAFRNNGWVLTPMPNSIPTDGSTINVYVDGVYLGNPLYNVYRSDIASLFPGYANSNGAHAYFDIDTTAYGNGVHSIAWTAEDSAGNSDGIGSRYFTVQNSARGGRRSRGTEDGGRRTEDGIVEMVRGYERGVEPERVYPGRNGKIMIEIEPLERLELHLALETGYQVVGGQYRPLPVGSTLDVENGIFYWQPGPGFTGEYDFVFIHGRKSGRFHGTDITVKIR